MNKKVVVALLGMCAMCVLTITNTNFYNQIKFKSAFKCEIIHKMSNVLIDKDKNYNQFMALANNNKDKIEKLQKAKELEAIHNVKKRTATLSRGGEIEIIEFTLSFYTSLTKENSSAGGITCEMIPLREPMVANNVLPLNTIINLEGYGEVIVKDHGSYRFDNPNRLDVFVARNEGESDRRYYKRVNRMGIQKVKGYIIN